MNFDFSRNRGTLILALVLIALGGVALLEQSALVVLMLLGLLFLVRQFDNQKFDTGADQQDSYEYDYYYEELEREREQTHPSEPIYRHALEAVNRAGMDPDGTQVLAVDIGMLSFVDDKQDFHRTSYLPDNVDYVQPFVQLRLPTKAKGRIRFEITDAQGDAIFIHEDDHNLIRGRNLLSPSARLAIHDERHLDGRWELRVFADGVLLAVHPFQFTEATNAVVREHIGEDGEINTELRVAMSESKLPNMSLDDLLAYQEEEQQQQAQS